MLARWAAAAALSCVLAGCGPNPAGLAVTTPAPADGAGSRLRAAVRVERPAAYRTQAVIDPYDVGDIETLAFELWRVGGAEPTLLDRIETTPARTVDWQHLRSGATYQIRVYALDESGTVLNAGGAPAEKDVLLDSDDEQTVAITLQLADRVFDGTVHPVVSAKTIGAEKVDRLSLTLFEKTDASWDFKASQATPKGSGLARTADFSHLKRGTAYRLVVAAMDAKGKLLSIKVAPFATYDDDYITLAVEL